MAQAKQKQKQPATDVLIAWQIFLFYVLSALIIALSDFAMAAGSGDIAIL